MLVCFDTIIMQRGLRALTVYMAENCKIVFLGTLPIQLLRHFCCMMYHLDTVHSITDRQTDDSIIWSINHMLTMQVEVDEC